ncbi:GntR family transcriptional regulator [Methylobacterium nonmethylotrophicum]|uniref:GntR family transcriptional regulator n=1 Tax=Methylobacterium nonmethylotrophicum TaxID=1141884 RepID=A0A4Z0NV54_9HYPH|nr:GntR family transcriptional regulator [Methylobacterium nonmethylotrophicum]TGE01047.1 GntR family transcriptional regulator [Methylobacterium nonmethylotrophicum]
METRYAYVARLLMEAIADGRYPVGSLLPNEHALADQFAVSRATVRAAMRELQNSGLISRRKSAGTRVEATAASPASGFSQNLESIEAVQQFGAETERHLEGVADIVADADLAASLDCQPGRRWLRVSFLRRIPDSPAALPICWTDVYLDADYGDLLRERVASHSGIYGTLLEAVSGRRIVEIRQRIRAVGVPPSCAAALQAEPGSHALAIRRQYFLSPYSMAEISLSIHPAERYSYQSVLKRQGDTRSKPSS